MPGLLIKNVPAELHRKLKRRARENRRSLSSEALVLLEAAVGDAAGPPTLAEIDELRVSGRGPLTDEIIASARTSGRP
jgi:plasmid stability protein